MVLIVLVCLLSLVSLSALAWAVVRTQQRVHAAVADLDVALAACRSAIALARSTVGRVSP